MIYAIFFLSGISGLMFQHIWFRQAGLVFGNSVWASSLVLSSFMAGLALGNALTAARPTLRGSALRGSALRRYAALETIVAITGLGLVFLLPMLGEGLVPSLVQAVGSGRSLGVVRFCLAFALLVIPTAAMGMTLPVLVGRTSSPERFGTTLGQLYGWNTLGAVAGALAGEALFYAWVGIRGTAYVAASLNLVAAFLSLLLARNESAPTSVVPDTPSARWTGDETRLLIVAALAGGSLLALEVIWTRFLLLFLFGTALSFAIMLALTLAGVALGSLIAARAPKRCASPSAIAVLGMLASIAVIASYTTFADVLRINLPGIPWMHWSRVVILTCALVFPTSMISGAFFTSVGTALSRTRPASQATGLLTLANTLGAMAGAMIAGFVLLPRLGMEGAFWLIAGTYFLAVVVSPGFGALLSRDRWVAGLAILSLAFVLLFPSGLMRRTYLRGALRPFTVGTTPAKISGFREGLTETLTYVDAMHEGQTLYTRLITNAFSMSATTFGGRRYMETFVYLPVAIHPDIRRALLVSYGVGSTARALVETKEIEHIDVVDISRDIIEMAPLSVSPGMTPPLASPRVTTHIEDGRFFLETSAEGYDLITSEPPPPHLGGVVNLYTMEYFKLLKRKLNPGGVVSYWLPVHSLSDDDSRAILSAFCAAFRDCTLWKGMNFDWIMLGTNGLQGPVNPERFRRQWGPAGPGDLRAIGLELPAQLGALFMADGSGIPGVATTAPLADNYPGRLSHAPPASIQFDDWRRDLMDTALCQQRFVKSPFIRQHWPAELISESLPYFRVQTYYDGMLQEMGPYRLKVTPSEIVALFKDSNLSVLPSILLGSTGDLQILVKRMEASNLPAAPWMDSVLGDRNLTQKKYAAAAAYFERALVGKRDEPDLQRKLVLSLCLSGDKVKADAARHDLPQGVNIDWDQAIAEACAPGAQSGSEGKAKP